TGGKFLLLAFELLPGIFSRRLRRVNAHLRRLDGLHGVADFDLDVLHQLARLQIYLSPRLERLAQVGLRRAVAQRQADLNADAPGAEFVLEKVAERRAIAAAELGIDRHLARGCGKGLRTHGRDKGAILHGRNDRSANRLTSDRVWYGNLTV